MRHRPRFSYGARVNFIQSSSRDVFENLALEDWLLDHGAEFAPLLLLAVNDPCVVIGKNQVPWRECATGRLRAAGVPLARRVSGGGTVFHDAGCLNYSFILPRDSYQQDEVFARVLGVLRGLGIAGEVGAHNGLFAGGRKFSGTAYCYRRQHVLHHGTLLVHSDLDLLRKLCAPALPQIETKAIGSRPASVVNLSELLPGLTTQVVAEELARDLMPVAFDTAAVASRAAELRGWDFVWGHSPRFEVRISGRKFQIEHGRIAGAPFAELVGQPFSREVLLAAKIPETGTDRAGFFQAMEGLDF